MPAVSHQLLPIRRLASVPSHPREIFKYPTHREKGILKPSSLARRGVLSKLKSYLHKYTVSGYENNTDVDELLRLLGLGSSSSEPARRVEFSTKDVGVVGPRAAEKPVAGPTTRPDEDAELWMAQLVRSQRQCKKFEQLYLRKLTEVERLQMHSKRLEDEVETLRAEAAECLHHKLQVVNYEFLLEKAKLDHESAELGLVDNPVVDLVFYSKMHRKLNEYREYLGAFDYYYQTLQDSQIREEYDVDQLELIKPLLTKLHHKLTTNFIKKKHRFRHTCNTRKLIHHLSVIHRLQVDLCHVRKALDEILVILKSPVA